MLEEAVVRKPASTCTVTLKFNHTSDKDDDVMQVLDCSDQFEQWLSDEVDAVGWGSIFGFITFDEWGAADFLLRQGLAPDQEFMVRFQAPHCYGPDLNGEYDSDPMEWDIVSVEPLAADEVLRRWEAFMRWWDEVPGEMNAR